MKRMQCSSWFLCIAFAGGAPRFRLLPVLVTLQVYESHRGHMQTAGFAVVTETAKVACCAFEDPKIHCLVMSAHAGIAWGFTRSDSHSLVFA